MQIRNHRRVSDVFFSQSVADPVELAVVTGRLVHDTDDNIETAMSRPTVRNVIKAIRSR